MLTLDKSVRSHRQRRAYGDIGPHRREGPPPRRKDVLLSTTGISTPPQKGDTVWGWDEETGRFGWKEVK